MRPAYNLAFGEGRALVHASETEFLDHLQQSGRPFSNASFRKHEDPVCKGYSVAVGGMTLAAAAGSGVRVSSRSIRQLSVVVPIHGGGTFSQGKGTHAIRAGNQIIRASYLEPLTVDYEGYSSVSISPSRSLLADELALLDPAMGTGEAALADVGTAVSEGTIQGVNYLGILQGLFSLIDQAGCDARLLERIGLESLLTRLLAEMILSQARRTVDDRTKDGTTGIASIDMICDHIAANIGKPLTMPQMERLSGLSSRSLGYAFRSRFNCTPQEWQRNLVLDEARRRLAAGGVSSSSIAVELGFSSLKRFAFYYRERFGDVPRDMDVET